MIGKSASTLKNSDPSHREIISGFQFSERARQLLKEPIMGVLAILRKDGSIIQTEMWYELKSDDTILLNTTTYRYKYRYLQDNPSISFFVSRGKYQYVTINGKVTLNKDPEIAQNDIRQLAQRYLGKEEASKIMNEEFSQQERVSIIITPTRITEYFSQ